MHPIAHHFTIFNTGTCVFFQGRAVKTPAALDEGLKYVIHIDNPRQISRSEDGKLIHLIGMLQTDKVSSKI
jgi:hypothetical protein